MNEALRLTALFVRDLLTYNEQLIRVGRQNYEIEDFEIPYIGVDALGAAQRLASGQKYDGTAEEMTYQQQWQAPVTLSFYGPDAWITATQFGLLIQSQKALELQESLGLGVYQVSTITDVKILAGMTYGERQDITLNVRFAISVDVDILRIDTAELEVRHEIIPFLSEENVMASSIDNLINVAFRKGQDLSGFGLKVGGKGDYRPPQFDAESLKFEYIDANESYGIDLNGSRFLQKLTFAESQDFTRATTGTFIGSNGQIQTAAIDAPRFTHDPVTREVQGLLIEEARTNVVIDSEDLTAASWGTFSSPDTTVSGPVAGYTTISFSATSSDRRFPRNTGVGTVADGEVGFIQARFKPGAGCTTIALGINKGPNKYSWASFNTDTGISDTYTVSDAGVSEFISATEVEPNVWELTVKVTGGDGEIAGIVAHFGDGDSASGLRRNSPIADCDVGFVQFERGGAATSYIPTAGTQVTRAADNCVRVLGAEFNPNEFSFYLEAPIPRLFDDRHADLIEFSDGSNNNRYFLRRGVNSTDLVFRGITPANGVIFTMTLGIAALSNQTAKISASVSSTSATLVVDGVSVSDTVSDALPVVTQFNLGTKWDGSNSIGEGVFKDVQLFPTALSEAELITLTGGT